MARVQRNFVVIEYVELVIIIGTAVVAVTQKTRLDLTICRTDLDASIQALHDSIEGPRQSAAQAASDALDPFEFEVDLDCED